MSATSEQLENVLSSYRVCSSPEQVNWKIRKQVDEQAIRDTLLPGLVSFLKPAICRRSVVALSGGLDSTVAMYLVAHTINHYRERDYDVSDFHLSVVHYPGLEDADGKALVHAVQARFPKVNVNYIEFNALPALQALAKESHRRTAPFTRKQVPGPGLLFTRTIVGITHEIAARLECQAINTTNGTEYLLGEYADGICFSVSPFINLYKSTLYGLGRVLGVPEHILQRRPVNSAFPFTDKLKLYFGDVPKEVSPQAAFETLDAMLYFLTEKSMTPRSLALRTDHSMEFLARLANLVDRQKPRMIYRVLGTEDKKEKNDGLIVVPYADVLSRETSETLLLPEETKSGKKVLEDYEKGSIGHTAFYYGGG